MTPRFTLFEAFFSLLRDLFDLLLSPFLFFYDTYIPLHLYPLSDTHGPKIPHAVLLFVFAISHVYHLHEYGGLSFTMWL